MRRIAVKLKLFLPYFVVVLVAVSILTLLSVRMANREIRSTIENNLSLEVQTISRMFEREYSLKLERVQSNLAVMNALFYAQNISFLQKSKSLKVTNQFSLVSYNARMPVWTINGWPLHDNNWLVDSLASLLGGTFTIFERSDSGFVRISTNVRNDRGERATGTYIPTASPVSQTILQKKSFTGRAFVVNDWYITAYEPIVHHGEVIGMLYAGGKEKDLDQLRALLNSIAIGKSGYVFAFDQEGLFVIHPVHQGDSVSAKLLQLINGREDGIIALSGIMEGNDERVAFKYFPAFQLYVCAAIDMRLESLELTRGIIRNAIIIALVSTLLFSLFLFFLTNNTVHRYLEQLEQSDKQLASAWAALERSANEFKTLFNNSSDEIFVMDFDGIIREVNDVACSSLGYTREELIGKPFSMLKTQAYQQDVHKNLEMIRHFGQHRYETENKTKSGKVIPMEMKSRVVEYDGEKRILSIARDITERKEIEERILKAIISTEERERKRFAADLHDDLGPILSTIKLYTDLLKSQDPSGEKYQETVASIDELTDLAIRTGREISNRIRPNVLQDFGLGAAIEEFCSFITKTGSLSIRVQTNEYLIEKRRIEESILFQVVKELVNNTMKHAQASEVIIDLKSFDNQVILYYRDNGIGFNASEAMQNKSGLGLYNIINKVKTINGTVDLNTSEGKGMFMTISVKLKEDVT